MLRAAAAAAGWRAPLACSGAAEQQQQQWPAAAALLGQLLRQQQPLLAHPHHPHPQQQLHTSAPAATRLSAADAAAIPSATTDGNTLLDARAREAAAIFRRFNIAQPGLRGQVVLARVLRSGPAQHLVDSGYYGLSWVPRSDVDAGPAYTISGRPITRRGGPVVRRGDFVKVRLAELSTPYGDPQLDGVEVPSDVRTKLVWAELAARMSRGSPVRGRVLNATVKGYAVAVGGYVALLPHDHALAEQTRMIGVLQDFYVHRMDASRRLISLSSIAHRSPGDMEELYRRSL